MGYEQKYALNDAAVCATAAPTFVVYWSSLDHNTPVTPRPYSRINYHPLQTEECSYDDDDDDSQQSMS